MKKMMAIFVALMFALSTNVYAGNATLSDPEMDQIAAGDWVILEEGQTVEDVFHSNNTLDLEDESQKEIQAVSNANAVDSAVAVSTNIATVTGDDPISNDIIGRNEADIINYNPSLAYSDAFSESAEAAWSWSTKESASSNYHATANASSVHNLNLVETLNIVETETITAAFASAIRENCKKCDTVTLSAAVFLSDFDYFLDYDKIIVDSETASASLEISASESETKAESKSASWKASSSKSSSSRRNLGENNHINLEDTSQRLTQAVSNLNAVGSGAAVQNNIASNVGVDGSISHGNAASVVSGF